MSNEQSFFRSLFSSNTSSNILINSDREKIDVKSLSDSQEVQAILSAIQSTSNSSSTRSKSLEKLTYLSSELDSTKLLDVWYLVKDLINSKYANTSTRRLSLNFLQTLIDQTQYSEDISRIHTTLFNDLILTISFHKDKLDPELDIIVEILNKLSNNGNFIHLYQNSFKQPLLELFIKILSHTDSFWKFPKALTLLTLVKNSVLSGLFTIEGSHDEVLEEANSLINYTIQVCLKTSDRTILESCIVLVDTIIQNLSNIDQDHIYNILEILCASAILDLQFLDLSINTIFNLINRNAFDESYFQSIMTTLTEVLLCSKPNLKDRTNGSKGVIKILYPLLLQYSQRINLEPFFKGIYTFLQHNLDNDFNQLVLQFFNELLMNDVLVNQIPAEQWDYSTEEQSSILNILSVLSNIITKDKKSTPELVTTFKLVLLNLQNLADLDNYPGSKSLLIDFFIRLNSGLLTTKNSTFILRFYHYENYCSPTLSNDWEQNCELILKNFYKDSTKDLQIRISTIKLIKDVFDSYYTSLEGNLKEGEKDILIKLLDFLFKNFETEEHTDLLTELTQYLTEISSSTSNEVFDIIIKGYIIPGFNLNTPVASQRRSSLSLSLTLSDTNKTTKPYSQKVSKLILKSFVKIFSENLITTNGFKSSVTYRFLTQVAKQSIDSKNLDFLLIISRLLVRLRYSFDNKFYITDPTDMDGLSAAFARNLNIRKSNASSEKLSEDELIGQLSIGQDLQSSVGLDEKWTYPEEISYLPKHVFNKPSNCLTLITNNSTSLKINNDVFGVNIDDWLNIVIQILESCPHWEIYSFIYTHFCPQLSNLKLFENSVDEIKKFRSLVCDQLTLAKLPFNSSSLPENLTKQDLQVAIIRNFTPLISYKDHFSKKEQDQIINALIVVLSSSWEKTAIPCVHILTVCCFELPISVKKYLSVILTNLQTRISSIFASAHILEFLLSLSYQPPLTSNFTVDEFKRAFGIAFKLIQYAHDLRQQSSGTEPNSLFLSHGEERIAESTPSTLNVKMTPVISIYLLTLSYDVISNWFLNMKLKNRRKLSSFIIKNLILSQSNEGELNHKNLAYLDLISRFTYSDLELKFSGNSPIDVNMKLSHEGSNVSIASSKWVYGSGIISVDTNTTNGESIISVRRATGTSVFKVIPDESMVPFYTNQLHSREADEIDEDDLDIFTDNYMFLQLVVHLDPSSKDSHKPIPIPLEDASFVRSLANFDRTSVVEFHKIGILYIAPNQDSETEILSNTQGSLDYQKFLSNFGRLITLKGCKTFYTGGLDTEQNLDGEFAYGWNDKILQLIFHTTTLMPNNLTSDPTFQQKKRHIGNNYVNIFFDESGSNSFDFNVIKSQFNFLNIVIQPHSITMDSSTSKNDRIKKYKVKVHRRSGVPALFATCHFKIVSEENLPTFVRTLSLIADQFAQIWHSNGNFTSNWTHRAKQILTIKEKALNIHEASKLNSKNNTDSNEQDRKSSGQSFLDQLSDEKPLSRNNSLKKPEVKYSQYEYVDPNDNEIFKNVEFTSFTK